MRSRSMCTYILLPLLVLSGALVQEVKITASDAEAKDRFGRSMALSGDYALVGAEWERRPGAGGAHRHVYRLVTASYTKSIKLVLLKKAEDFLTTNGHE